MLESSEFKYAEGDIVWVKLRSFWWPGQVVSLKKLPEDIQKEFEKKTLIAAVKFFQEDSFEFVKNYQQIFQYNCSQKNDFIKKGLDKYRAKSRDGSKLMDKFPQDIKTAEILTNGNPDILSESMFLPKTKPNISGLFGKKNATRKKEKTHESSRIIGDNIYCSKFSLSNGVNSKCQEIQQPINSQFSVEYYPCYLCGFTANRVNVIIFHIKNHRINRDNVSKSIPKAKAVVTKRKRMIQIGPLKQKQKKFISNKLVAVENEQQGLNNLFNFPKITKVDPELREKILADWNLESDEEDALKPPADTCSNRISETSKEFPHNSDNFCALAEIHQTPHLSNSTENKNSDCKPDSNTNEKTEQKLILKACLNEKIRDENKIENSLELSCFDFNEEEFNQTNMTCIRKFNKELIHTIEFSKEKNKIQLNLSHITKNNEKPAQEYKLNDQFVQDPVENLTSDNMRIEKLCSNIRDEENSEDGKKHCNEIQNQNQKKD